MKLRGIAISIILLAVFFISTGILAMNIQVEQHEKAHAQICKYVGGFPNITYTNFGISGITACSGGNDAQLILSDTDYRMRAMLDSMNESIQYQLAPLSFLIIIFSFVICLFLMLLIELR